MKKNITHEIAHDPAGHQMLRICKAKGNLTLDEIKSEAKEYGQGYYGLVLRCTDDDKDWCWVDDIYQGDIVEMYDITDMLKTLGRVKEQ